VNDDSYSSISEEDHQLPQDSEELEDEDIRCYSDQIQDIIENFQHVEILRLTKNPMYSGPFFYDEDDHMFNHDDPTECVKVKNEAVQNLYFDGGIILEYEIQ
jgi:hypothetical protein